MTWSGSPLERIRYGWPCGQPTCMLCGSCGAGAPSLGCPSLRRGCAGLWWQRCLLPFGAIGRAPPRTWSGCRGPARSGSGGGALRGRSRSFRSGGPTAGCCAGSTGGQGAGGSLRCASPWLTPCLPRHTCPWVCRMTSPLGWARSWEPQEATGGRKEVERGTRAHCRVAPPASRRAGTPPPSRSRPAAPALSLAAAVALCLAAWSTLGRLPCGTAPSQPAPPPSPPPSPPAAAGGARRRVLAWIVLLDSGQCQPVAAFSAALSGRLPGPHTRRSQRGWGASAAARGLAGPGRTSWLDSGASRRVGRRTWGRVVV